MEGEIVLEPRRSREVVRLRPDGTSWIAPDITADEMFRTFDQLVMCAAGLLKKVKDCEASHKS